MFTNPEKKLSILIKISTILTIIVAIIISLYFLLDEEDGTIFLIALVCAVYAWVLSLFVLSFCELCENIKVLRFNLTNLTTHNQTTSLSTSAAAADATIKAKEDAKIINSGGWKCLCGKVHPGYVGTCTCGGTREEALKK